MRGTRPWTVVTLSDYGRDRLAYQAYDTLFAPELPARQLPVGNRYVLKIQAAQALLDWLAPQLAPHPTSAPIPGQSCWQPGPTSNSGRHDERAALARRSSARHVLRQPERCRTT